MSAIVLGVPLPGLPPAATTTGQTRLSLTLNRISLSAALDYVAKADGLKVKLPDRPPGKYAFALKITGLKMNRPGPAVPAEPPGPGQ